MADASFSRSISGVSRSGSGADSHGGIRSETTSVSHSTKRSSMSSGRIRRRGKVDLHGADSFKVKDHCTLSSRLEKDNIDTIYTYFQMRMADADPFRPRKVGSGFDLSKISKQELKRLLFEYLHITMDQEDFEVAFTKMDSDRSETVDWNELVSHMLVELAESEFKEREKDRPSGSDLLVEPISGLPQRLRSHHRHAVLRITFCPEVFPDRSHNELYGKFVTASKDGTIQFWSMDLTRDRSVMSSCVLLKVRPTWVTDVVCLPDINMVCTSSTERELRFYDTTANKWELRVLISKKVNPVLCMHYHMSKEATEESRLIMGDMGGDICVFLFCTVRRGPFRQKVGCVTTHVQYPDLLKGALPGLRVVEFTGVHSDWVRQVSYYSSLHSFLSCATCPGTSMFMCDALGTRNQYRYHVDSGLLCFAFAEETHMIVTGGPDCILRAWNPFVSSKPSMSLVGHHAAIVGIVIQDAGKRVFSIDLARYVRVWDMASHSCIQMYTGLTGGPKLPLVTFYHSLSRAWILADREMHVIRLGPQLNPDRIDGITHVAPVSFVLYNPLFKFVVTMCHNSCIMVWDPWRGRRVRFINYAHSRTLHGREEPVEITAACFDPGKQLLLTGAADGTLRIWNFNTGACVRNMNIRSTKEVTAVCWVPSRILAVGWDMRVTEWADTGAALHGKAWETRHTGHILCAAARPPDALATASERGELVLWRLETGQPYARYNVAQPVHKSGMAYYTESEVQPPSYWPPLHMPKCTGVVGLPPRVHAIHFLQCRPVSRGLGTLLTALSTGYVQVWSHHSVGGYLTNFLAVHTLADYVMCMCTDPECNFVFTGHSAGYIKAWLFTNYCYPGGPVSTIFMPALRKQFPFLFKELIPGRAKRAVRSQPMPLLLSSYRGHLQPVTSLEIIAENKLLLSSSADHTVRMWTLGGEYVATLGTFLPWPTLVPGKLFDLGDQPPLIPADLKRISSNTTLKVLHRGVPQRSPTVVRELAEAQYQKFHKMATTEDLLMSTYGMRPYRPVLGKCFALPSHAIGSLPTVQPDNSYNFIPVYANIKLSEETPIPRPPTPESVAEIKNIKLNDPANDDAPKNEPSPLAVDGEP